MESNLSKFHLDSLSLQKPKTFVDVPRGFNLVNITKTLKAQKNS